MFAEFIDSQEPDAAHAGGFPRIDQQLVFHECAVAAAAALEVFELFQSLQMHAHLEFAPAGGLSDVATGKVASGLIEGVLVHHGTDVGFDVLQQVPGLVREFIEAAAKYFRGEAVGGGNVVKGGADVGTRLGVVVERALVLVQQGDGVDEREVFLVIAML